MKRRRFLVGGAGSALFSTAMLPLGALAQNNAGPFRRNAIAAWERRIRGILDRGRMPIIDMQATYEAKKTDLSYVIKQMDRLDIAQIAFAAANAPTSAPSLELHRKHPERFVPTTNSGEFERWRKNPKRFVSGVAKDLKSGSYFVMGEHEFRHYPSPEQVKAGRTDRDVTVTLDGPAGHSLFQLSQKSELAFQIHYEIEDALLPALESMLRSYPRAKVIWCHLAMIRYPDRAKTYSPEYVASLIKRFPNLHFDLAVPEGKHIYVPSGARDSTLFTRAGQLEPKWRAIIEASPERFLAASDYRPDVERQYPDVIGRQRRLIAELDPEVRSLVAFQNAWRLVTGERWKA